MLHVTEESVRRLLAEALEERDRSMSELREHLSAELGLLERRLLALEGSATHTSQADGHGLKEASALGSSTGGQNACSYFLLGGAGSEEGLQLARSPCPGALNDSRDVGEARLGTNASNDEANMEMPSSSFVFFLYKARQAAREGSNTWHWLFLLWCDVTAKSMLAWAYSEDFQRPLDAMLYQHSKNTVDFSCFYQSTLVQTAHQTVPRITLVQSVLCFMVMSVTLQRDDSCFISASPVFFEFNLLQKIVLSVAWCSRVIYMPLLLARGAALSMSFMRNPASVIVESLASIFIVDLDELMFNVLVSPADKEAYQRDGPSMPGFAIARVGSLATLVALKALTFVFMISSAVLHLTTEPWTQSSFLKTWVIFAVAVLLRSVIFAQFHERNYPVPEEYRQPMWLCARYARYVIVPFMVILLVKCITWPLHVDADFFQKFSDLSSCIAELGEDCSCEDVPSSHSGGFFDLAGLR